MINNTSVVSKSIKSSRIDLNRVVLEIGSAYTKCGFVGEATPRRVFKNPRTLSQLLSGELSSKMTEDSLFPSTIIEKLKRDMSSLLDHAFFRVLQINPDQIVQLFVSENIYALHRDTLNSLILETIQNMNFSIHFKSEEQLTHALQFLTSQYCVVACTGNTSGLIIDVGYSETRIVPICFGREVLNSLKIIRIGSKHALERLKQHVYDHNPHLQRETDQDKAYHFESNVLEDILIRICYCSPIPIVSQQVPNKSGATRASIPAPWPKIPDIEEEKKRLKDHTARPLGTATQPTATSMIHSPRTSPTSPRQHHNPRLYKHKKEYIDYYHEPNSVIKIEKQYSRCEPLEVFFCEDENGYSIIDGILECLLACEVDVRTRIIGNIVLCGGGTMYAGFLHRFCSTLKDRIKHPRFHSINKLIDNLLIFQPGNLPRHHHAWTGASVLISSVAQVQQQQLSSSNHNHATENSVLSSNIRQRTSSNASVDQIKRRSLRLSDLNL